MSVLKDARNLILGNGDIILADTLAALPSVSAYKAALAAGTLGAISGNVGAIKGTVSLQIIREMIQFETGVPQEVADMTCIREGVHLKCSLAELSLANVKRQIGGGGYSTTTAGSTHFTGTGATAEIFTAIASAEGEPVARAFTHQPVLKTTSTPAAAANPVVKDAAETTTFVEGTDYTLDLVTGTLTWLASGGISAGDIIHITSYYYNPMTSETLTMGGSADVTQSVVGFYHPYKDGRVLQAIIYKASPIGTVTLPFEEIAYSHSELEFRGIADFSRASNDHLFRIYRDIPT